MTLEELKIKATKLGITFDDDITEEVLEDMVDAAEAEKNKKSKTLSVEELQEELAYKQQEFEKARDKRDKANKDKRKLQSDYNELKKTIANFPDADELASIREELSTLRDERKEQDKREEDLKLSKKTDYEREIYARDKEKDKLTKELEKWKTERESLAEKAKEDKGKAEVKIKVLRKRNLEAEIMSVASKNNVWNAQQIARLTKDDFTYDEDLDKYVYIERGRNDSIKKEQDVDEYITEFLSREDNENLIRSNMNTESLNTTKTSTKTTSSKGKIGDYSPTDPEIIKRAELEGMEPERYIKVILENPKKKQEQETG